MLPLTEGGDGRHDLAGSRTAVALGARDRERPERLARMRTTQVAARARILLPCDSGETPGPNPAAVRLRRDAGRIGRTSDGVRPCATRHLESGVERALSDGAHGGRPREIDGADRAFVADLACQRPADPGHSAGSRASDLPADRAGEAAEAVGHPRLATVATGNAQHPGRRPDRAPQDGQLPRAAVPRRGAGHPGRARIPPPTCDPSRAAGARSGEATGTGGSGRSLLASANRRPARRPPRGQDARGPRPRRIPGRQAPEGRPDAGRVWRRLGAHPREGETPPAVRPGPPRARVRALSLIHISEPTRP